MSQMTCPNCTSEDLESAEMSTAVQIDGRTIIGCDYCIERGAIVAGEEHLTGLDRALYQALSEAQTTAPVVTVTAQWMSQALSRRLRGWTVGAASDGSTEAGLYHSCEPEPVAWMDDEGLGAVLERALSHTCKQD